MTTVSSTSSSTTNSSVTTPSNGAISGLVSGIDTASLVQGMLAVDQAVISKVEVQDEAATKKLAEWKSVSVLLLNVKIQAMIMNRSYTFQETAATSSNPDVIGITSGTAAEVGSQVIKVVHLAQGQQTLSRGFGSKTASVPTGDITIAAGNGTDDHDVNAYTRLAFLNNGSGVDTSHSIQITNRAGVAATIDLSGATTMQDVLDAINNKSGLNVTAEINANGTGLKLTDVSGGTGPLSVAEAGGGTSAHDLGINTSVAAAELTGTDLTPRYKITVDATNDSLEGVRDAINELNGPFSASIVNTGSSSNPYKLSIVSKNTGIIGTLNMTSDVTKITDEAVGSGDGTKGSAAGDYSLDYAPVNSLSNIESITVGGVSYAVKGVGAHGTTGNESEVDLATGKLQFFVDGAAANVTGDIKATYTPLGLDLNGAAGLGKTTQVAQDAEFQLGTTNPETIYKHTNSVSDVISGVTFTLLKPSDTAVAIDVKTDFEGIKKSVTGFIDAYNTLMDKINSEGTYDVATKTKGGVLFGDSSLMQIQNDLQRSIMDNVSGGSGTIKSIFQIGITSDLAGKLTVNDTELTQALTYHLSDVTNLFSQKANIAFGSAGTTTVASSTASGYAADNVLGGSGGWMGATDLTQGADYFSLNFNRTRNISKLILSTQDTTAQPAGTWGINSYAVQYLRLGGSADKADDWVTASNVTGNTSGTITTYLSNVATEHLRLKITGTNAADHFARINNIQAYEDTGIGGGLNNALGSITDAGNGIVSFAADSLNAQISDYTDRITMLTDRMTARSDYLSSQFSKMETFISNMKSQGNWLTSQANALNNSKSSN